MGRGVSRAGRRWAAVSVSAAIAGVGLGRLAGGIGLGLTPGLDVSIAVLGMGALIAVFVAGPPVSEDPPVATEEVGWTEFRRELRRSRRAGRPLTLVRLAGDELPAGGMNGSDDLLTRSRRLRLHVRLVDRTWVDDGSIYVLLPESPRSAANVLIERIRERSPGQLPERVRIATFPEDGLTSGALIAAVFDGALDAVPIPIHQRLGDFADPGDQGEAGDAGGVAAMVIDEQVAVGEAART
jgi:hypothetical protein